MQQWKKNMYVLWVAGFISAMCFTLVTPFMPLFLMELNVERGLETWSGLLVSASFFSNAIMSPVWGSLADRYGRKIMVIRSGVGQAIVYALQFFVANPYQFLVLRILNGMFSGMNPSCIALAATNTPDENLGYCLGVLQTSAAAGTITGPLIGGVLVQYIGYRETFVAASVLLVFATVIVALFVKETSVRRTDSKVQVLQDLKLAFANRPLRMVLFAAVLVQASLSVLQPVLTLQVVKLGRAETATVSAGIIYSLAGIATVIAAPLWARRAKRAGFRQVLTVGLLGAGVLNIPLAFVGSLYTFGALRFGVGLLTAGALLSVNALTAQSVETEFRGRAFGILASFVQMGHVVGPMAGGLTGTYMGLEATFILASLMLLTTALMVVRSVKHDRVVRTA